MSEQRAMRTYEDFDDAAGASFKRMALTREIFTVMLPRGVRKLKICKPLFQSPFGVYASAPTIKCPEWQFSYDLVDQCSEWEPF